MTLYIGVDFHPHQQTVAWCDRQTGEVRTLDLAHDLDRVREFYSSFSGPVVIGIEGIGEGRVVREDALKSKLSKNQNIFLQPIGRKATLRLDNGAVFRDA